MPRPFRFAVNMIGFADGRHFRDRCRLAEQRGYDAILVPDHLGMPAPFPALVAAAQVTERARLGTFVLNAGFWNPALLAREAATCDQLTGGRLELGLGAGYMKDEHDAAGLPFASPGGRVAHLEHTVVEVRRLLADPGQEPGPLQEKVPVVLGGNGGRVLRLAAREADIMAFTGARQAPGKPEGTLELISPSELERRTSAFRDLAAEEGRTVELNYLVQLVADAPDRRAKAGELAPYAPDLSERELLEHPALLLGSPKEMAEQLRAHRERFGLSYFTVLDKNLEAFAPVIEELAGG
ncbi:TIGR03621 family F420-dependent LLM class oxidoreductase [Streptomyces axinellae]|uniref:TIGR03621 family F420-dependent LLM class oxidoreductase n=1 Tax=Streptomyces axinellae TaxID=552788 RepID=A0ABN3QA40_9ACTN